MPQAGSRGPCLSPKETPGRKPPRDLNGVCLVLISFSLGGGWAFQQKDIFSFCQLQAFNFSLLTHRLIKNTLSKPGFFLGADVIVGGEVHLLECNKLEINNKLEITYKQ